MFNLELEQVRDLNSEMKKYYRPLPQLAHYAKRTKYHCSLWYLSWSKGNSSKKQI